MPKGISNWFEPRPGKQTYPAVFALLAINLGIWALAQIPTLNAGFFLGLRVGDPSIHQFLTANFVHLDWYHLSSNMFFLYLFGRIVEEEEGPGGLWLTYLACGVFSSITSWIFLPPATISVGASGSLFGIFCVAVFVKLGTDWRRLLEVLILGQFFAMQIWTEVQQLPAQDNVNRIAHLSGAFGGFLLIVAAMYLRRRERKKLR